MRIPARLALVLLSLAVASRSPASADERLCDPGAEDCRAPLLQLIRNETVGIDVAFWFMEETRYPTELIRRFRAGIPVRVLVDPRASAGLNAGILQILKDAGIPMRYNASDGILHWKMMLFAGQRGSHGTPAHSRTSTTCTSAPLCLRLPRHGLVGAVTRTYAHRVLFHS